jgi:hypothetical protein
MLAHLDAAVRYPQLLLLLPLLLPLLLLLSEAVGPTTAPDAKPVLHQVLPYRILHLCWWPCEGDVCVRRLLLLQAAAAETLLCFDDKM